MGVSWACRASILLWLGLPAVAWADPVLLSDVDRDPSIQLSPDRLGVSYSMGLVRGVRSDAAVLPGSGFFYYEGHREAPEADYGFGLATAGATLADFGGASDQSLGVNTLGFVTYGGGYFASFPGSHDTYGFAVDYRGLHPIVYLIASQGIGAPGEVLQVVTMSNVTAPLFIYVYGSDLVAGVLQTINTGNNTTTQPFTYDPVAALDGYQYRGAEGLTLRWRDPDEQPSLQITTPPNTILLGSALSAQATASDPEDGVLTPTIAWTDDASAATGTGGTVSFTPTAVGRHRLTATVSDSNGSMVSSSVEVWVISNAGIDSDGDGLSYAAELLAGSDPNRPDTDGDGLSDGAEVQIYGSNPTVLDSDLDGMPDAYEVAHGLDPAVANAQADPDADSYSNLAEYLAGSDPNLAASYPGFGEVLLSATDKDPSITLTVDGRGVLYGPVAGTHGVRSVQAIQPGSGWYYYEGHREVAPGAFGFGVASAAAPLNQAGGATNQSVGVTALGDIRYNGASVGSLADPTTISDYGLAVDYRGANPVVYVLVDCVPVAGWWEGQSCHDAPFDGSGLPVYAAPGITMTAVTGPLHIYVYGETTTVAVQQTINGGARLHPQPFHLPAAYVLFGNGVTAAEEMGTGWGPEHSYAGRVAPPEVSRVELVQDQTAGDGIIMAPDRLGASYTINQKSAIRANQGMIGQFRYFETHRVVEPINIGSGVIPLEAQTNPYPFNPQQPSMSVNSLGGVWQNLVFMSPYPTSNDTYGFAVDYRGPRPIIYVIIGGIVEEILQLETFSPIYPMLYGHPVGPRLANTINFGATPFFYDAAAILAGSGVDTSAFVTGWGAINVPQPAPVCGNGVREGAEACDDGNVLGGDCCSASCAFEPVEAPCTDGTFCNGSDACNGAGVCVPGLAPVLDDGVACTTDACDEVNDQITHTPNHAACDDGLYCTGVETCSPSLGCSASGNPCASGAVCNQACNELADNCFDLINTPCGSSSDTDCDDPDSCDGAGACRPNRTVAGTVCRDASGLCDQVEMCNGTSSTCPLDELLPSGTSCRGATGDCDLPESCDGLSSACPADVLTGSGVACRPAAGACDLSESCDGASPACPPDLLVAGGIECRPAATACDAPEACDGASVDCGADLAAGDGLDCADGVACNGSEVCGTGACQAATPLDCDDGDLCTTNACTEPGGCGSEPILGCCNQDPDCDDGNLCTMESCTGLGGTCTSTTVAGCCNIAADCDDGDACTAELCSGLGGTCTSSVVSGCCHQDADCGDQSLCTTDSCDLGSNTCVHTPVAGCCSSDSDCADGLACTDDSCELSTGTCQNAMRSDCCNSDADCADGDDCTADRCPAAGGACEHTASPSCCTTDAACDDQDACTQDVCDLTLQRCGTTPIAGCCHSNDDCGDLDACTSERCDIASQTCVVTPVAGCCHLDSDCDDQDACTVDRCGDTACLHDPIAGCGDEGSGCSCRAAGGPPATSWPGLLLLALGLSSRSWGRAGRRKS